MRITICTIYHTGSYSAAAAFRTAGWAVAPNGGERIGVKLATLTQRRNDPVLWAHWRWVDNAPWLLRRRVITMLRDPVAATISHWIRHNGDKSHTIREQWQKLHKYRGTVDHWVPFEDINEVFARDYDVTLPRLNVTRGHEIQDIYREGEIKRVRKMLGKHWLSLEAVQDEIAAIYDVAGLPVPL